MQYSFLFLVLLITVLIVFCFEFMYFSHGFWILSYDYRIRYSCFVIYACIYIYIFFLSENENGAEYEFGITSLTNKRELLQVDDPVQFQIDSKGRAANITAIRKKRKATVDAIKGVFEWILFFYFFLLSNFLNPHLNFFIDSLCCFCCDTVSWSLPTVKHYITWLVH